MYLTAHRVWSRQHLREGVHAFYYRHPEPLQTPIDIAQIADRDPGELVCSLINLPAGGNDVWSYLDLAAPGELTSDQLATALARLADAVRSEEAPVVHSQNDAVACRFYANPNRIPSRAAEVEALTEAMRRVYADRHNQAPLRLVVERREHSGRLHLHPESVQRLRALLGAGWHVPPGVNIDDDIKSDFEALHGSIFQHLIPVLTGLEAHQIQALGGVRFVRPDGSEIEFPGAVQRTIHVVGDLGHSQISGDHGEVRSGNVYEILDDDAVAITTMLGADLIDQEVARTIHVEWNGFTQKR